MAWEFFDAVGRVKQAVSGPPVPMDPWHVVGAAGEPAFQNGWVDSASSTPPVGFRKYPDGRVAVRGNVKSGTLGQAAFLLPVGYKPPGYIELTVMAAGSPARLQVAPDGGIYPITGPNTSIYLDAISFDTASVLQVAGAPAGTAPLVAGLPTNPVDGQECMYLADAVNGVIWRLRYRAAAPGAYKWEFVGGSALRADALAQVGPITMAAGTWLDMGAVIAVTVPLAGDYDCRLATSMYNNTGGSSEQDIGVAVGATLPAGSVSSNATTTATGTWTTLTQVRAVLAVPALTALTFKFNQSSGGSTFRQGSSLRATPVRVG